MPPYKGGARIKRSRFLVQTLESGGTDLPSFEPVFAVIGPKIEKLRGMYKTNPRRFDVAKLYE